MEQSGIVLETQQGQALVKITRATACGETCGSCNLCDKKEITRWVQNTARAVKGDTVKIVQDSKSLLIMAFVAYILPIILAGSVALIASRFIESRGMADAVSFSALALTVLATAKYGGKMFRGERFQSRIIEIVEKKYEQI